MGSGMKWPSLPSLLFVLLISACDDKSTEPRSEGHGPGSAYCKRLEEYLLAPGDTYGTPEYFQAKRDYRQNCTGGEPSPI